MTNKGVSNLERAVNDIDFLDRPGCLNHWREVFGRPPAEVPLASIHEAGTDLGTAKQGAGSLIGENRTPTETNRVW